MDFVMSVTNRYKSNEKISWNQSTGKNLLDGGVMVMSSLTVNFCKQEEMSICTADSRNQQAGCCFYEKSRFAERCMYYIFDEYCDCLKAQINSETTLPN
jgi:hypothetical protein